MTTVIYVKTGSCTANPFLIVPARNRQDVKEKIMELEGMRVSHGIVYSAIW